MKRKCTLVCFYFMFSLGLGGCSNLPYYLQSIQGHSEIIIKREPINAVLKQEINHNTRHKLNLVLELVSFAKEELLLPNHGSYTDYADIKRRYVVWNVFATPELSLTPKTWCYVFVGCLSYRGYYNRDHAEKLADQLSQQGMDVFVGGVSAYSTLGWFNDPILNTMLNYDDLYLARIIFHELSHQKIYIKNDSEFNEAFSDSIAIIGVDTWLKKTGQQSQYKKLIKEQEYETEFVNLLLDYKNQLEAVYDSELSVEIKRARKQNLFKQFKEDYQLLSENWHGYKGFDNWFNKPLSNARFSAVSTYRELVPAFLQLYENLNGNLAYFYETVSSLENCSKQQRRIFLYKKHEPQHIKQLCQ